MGNKLDYFKKVCEHKYYVYKAGVKLGVPRKTLILHDWQKFTPSEFVPYANYFYGGKQEKDKESFMYSWLHHVHYGKHHWEYWLLNPNYNFATAKDGCLPMPEVYIREMVADWMGASMAYTGSWDMTDWLEKNLSKLIISESTVIRLIVILWFDLDYDQDDLWKWRKLNE